LPFSLSLLKERKQIFDWRMWMVQNQKVDKLRLKGEHKPKNPTFSYQSLFITRKFQSL
jgi:hypothetical protein